MSPPVDIKQATAGSDDTAWQARTARRSGKLPLAAANPALNEAATARQQIDAIVSAAVEPVARQTERLARIKAADQPLLEAAQPLLLALAQMPAKLGGKVAVEALRQLLEREVACFQALCGKAGIRPEHATAASYCLCTALDEAASSTRWGGAQHAGDVGRWSARMLASTFHGDVDGGSKCFLLLGRFAMEPQEHSALLELMYRLLSLGFEGQYGGADGRRQLTAIRQRLLEMVTASHGVVPQELSTHWRGEAAVRPAFWRRIPAWLPATLLGLVLCALFAGAGYQLRLNDSELAARLARIGNIDASAPLRPGD